MLLESLKFVQGAVAKKDFVPALTHFLISQGRIIGYNGEMALSCPIDLDIEAKPEASSFIKAIKACKKEPSIHVTDGGRLAIKSGTFKAYIKCIEDPYPEIKPEGDILETQEDLFPIFKKLEPFIAEDASRQWARGLLLRGGTAFATNNIVIVQHWLGQDLSINLNIPKPAIKEMIRIKENPIKIQYDDKSVTFHYSQDKWIRTQVYTSDWPDVNKILDQYSYQDAPPEYLFEKLENILPFIDDLERIFFLDDHISTSHDEKEGASEEVEGLVSGPIFNAKQLLEAGKIIDKIDFSSYPNPCLFTGSKLRGAIVGMRS